MDETLSLEQMSAITEEDVKTRVLSRLTTGLQTREGSFTNDVISAMAVELCDLYHTMAALLDSFYLTDGSGEYIDRQAAAFDLLRKTGAKATCALTVSGADGATVPAGTAFYTLGSLTYLLDSDLFVSGGTASGTLTAESVGAAYNINAGEISSTIKNYPGIESYTNGQASGGVDVESDADFLARFLKRLRRPPTSGNPYQYQEWAESVTGVGAARIASKWAGAGTVKVILASPSAETVDSSVVTQVTSYIETVRPVGPAVTVVSATARNLAIAAAVSIDGTTTKQTVQTAFLAACKDYLKSLVTAAFDDTIDVDFETIASQTYTLNYNHLVYLLLKIPGVSDFSSLTVGGAADNVVLAADEVPVLTGVTVS